jgi:hypothetical protein
MVPFGRSIAWRERWLDRPGRHARGTESAPPDEIHSRHSPGGANLGSKLDAALTANLALLQMALSDQSVNGQPCGSRIGDIASILLQIAAWATATSLVKGKG